MPRQPKPYFCSKPKAGAARSAESKSYPIGSAIPECKHYSFRIKFSDFGFDLLDRWQ